MSATDHILLSRPDHQTSLAGSIQDEKEFCDLSLACEDQQLQAHKVVLAAGSTKLRSILLGNPHPQPVIYLHGVKFSTLENIVKFIYHGEVVISRDQVNSFLAVAQDLKVKGLTEPPGGAQTRGEVYTITRTDSSLGREERSTTTVTTVTDGDYEGEYVESEDEDEDEEVKPKMEKIKAEVITKSEEYVEDTEDIKELIKCTTDAKEDQEIPTENVEDDNNSSSQENGGLEEEEVRRPKLENMNSEDIAEAEQDDEDGDGDYLYEEDEDEAEDGDVGVGGGKKKVCPYCQKEFDRPSNLKSHIRGHTKEKPFRCPHCSKTCTQKSNLNAHIKTVHLGARPHQCQYCNKAFGYSSHLKSHIKTQHQE